MKKISLAIFDLTDCEGCELQFLALREELAKLGNDLEITNWRLVQKEASPGPFTVTFVEGSPITEADIETVKQARRVSEKIIAIGTCAVFGGLQASLPETNRSKGLKEVYGEKYKNTSKAPRPLSYYIDVDIELSGCPIEKYELKKLLSALLAGKKFQPVSHPVCLECKAKNNACLFLDEGFCLGPVTKGGCGAVCPEKGLFCYGCFGPLEGGNLGALKKAGRHLSEKEIDDKLKLYFNHSKEYKDYKSKGKNG